MLRALIEGKATTQEMANLAQRKLRKKIPELEPALGGKLEEHHRFLLRLQLDRLETAEKDLAVLEQRIQEKLQPYDAQVTLLDEIPGVDWTLAAVIIAELGVDMKVFENVAQLASWTGVSPGNNESAGKRKSSRIPKGERISEDRSGRGCYSRGTHQGYLSTRQVLPSQSSTRIQARHRGSGAIKSWWPSITCFLIVSATTSWAISTSTDSTSTT